MAQQTAVSVTDPVFEILPGQESLSFRKIPLIIAAHYTSHQIKESDLSIDAIIPNTLLVGYKIVHNVSGKIDYWKKGGEWGWTKFSI